MALPAQMTLIETDGSGPPEVMKLATGPLPVPQPDEVLIRVLAAGVNRPDIAHSGAGSLRRGRRGRKRGHELENRRPCVRADQWRCLR
jgi:D-arabinose 1-dehydrogenase-like Zn-dependent alcohol dehydrogenase